MSMERDDEPQYYKPTKQEELFAVVLTRIDERTKTTAEKVNDMDREFREFRGALSGAYVSVEKFNNLVEKVNLHQKVLFGTIGIICTTVLAAILATVVTKGG